MYRAEDDPQRRSTRVIDVVVNYDQPTSSPPPPPPPPLPDPSALVPGGARSTDPATSWIAALSDLPRKATQRRRLLDVHFDRDGLTNAEASIATGIREHVVSTRHSELCHDGWLRNTGLTRLSGAGGMQVVWGMTVQGRQQYTRDQ